MSEPLYILLPDDLDDPWHWSRGDRQDLAASGSERGALGELDAHPVHVFIAGQSIRILAHDLPPMKDADRQQAAGFAVEARIGAALSDQHIVLGTGEDRRVAIIAREKMANILDRLKQAGIHADGIHADFDAWRQEEQLRLEDRIIQGGALGHTLDPDWGDAGASDTPARFFAGLETTPALNLLTGDYARRTALPINISGLMRVAALFLLCTFAWMGLQWAEIRAMTQQAENLKAQAAALYTNATGHPAPPNPALAVSRVSQNNSARETDFLTLSALLWQAISRTDGVMIETLQFDAGNQMLSLRLVYPQFESADQLQRAITDLGGQFQAGGVREQSGRLIGDATLRLGDGA